MNKKLVGIIILTLLIVPIVQVAAVNTSSINSTVDEAPHDPLVEGPSKAKYGEICNYTAVSTDPQGDEITYEIGFSDAPRMILEIGPNESGEKIEFSHAWWDFYQEENPYKVRIKAIDSKGYESDWTRFITIITNDTAKNKEKIESNPKIYPVFNRIVDYFNELEIHNNYMKQLFGKILSYR